MKLKFLVLFIFIASISGIRSFAQITANFTADVTSGCAPLTNVHFTNTSTPADNATWEWTLGNGNTSTQQNPIATYSTAGTYIVTLKATRNTQTSTISLTITVYNGPTANFTTIDGVTKACTNKTFRFTSDQSTKGDAAISGYFWSFGDGGTNTNSNEDHNYTKDSIYNVFLTITDLNGCTNTMTKNNYIDVASLPVVSFLPNPPYVCKLPASVSFINASKTKGGASYLWNAGGSFVSFSKDANFNFTAYNTYTVNLTVTDTIYKCSVSYPQDYTIIQTTAVGTLKQGSKTISNTGDNICAGPVIFNSTSLPLSGHNSWNFDGVASFTFANGQYSINDAGTHNVSLVSYGDYCTDTLKWNFSAEKVVPQFTMAPDNSCQPSAIVAFTNNSSINAASYSWTFANGAASTLITPPSQTFTAPADADNYTIHDAVSFPIKLIAATVSGCKDSITKTFTIKRPTALFTADTLSGCASLKVNFTDESLSDSTITSRVWTFGDGNTASETTKSTEQHTYTTAGVFNVQLTITNNNNCSDISYSIPIEVGTPPSAGFTVSPATPVCQTDLVTITNTTPVADFWRYTINGLSIPSCSDISNPIFRFKPDTGTLTIIQTVGSNGCYAQTTKTITNKGPIASFTDSIPDCNNPYAYNFKGSATGKTSGFKWLVDGVQVSTSQSPAYSFLTIPANKDYTVKFIVIGPSCSDTATQIVHVRQKIASFTALTDACAYQSVNFTGAASQPFTTICKDKYYWDFNDNTSIIRTDTDPISHTFNKSGNYKVLLSAIHDNGCIDTVSHRIRVYKPTPILTANTYGGCKNTKVTFTDGSIADVNPITSLYMDYGDKTNETSSVPKSSFIHNYGPVNLYTPYLKVTDSKGCFDSTYVTIGIANPVVHIQPLGILPQTCVNTTITFIQDADEPDNVLWTFGDGATSTLNASSVEHIYTNEGDYTAKIKVTKFGCSDSSSKLMQLQKADASFTVSDSIDYCPQKPITFTHTTPSKYILEGEWDTGDTGNTTVPYDTATHIMKYLYQEPGIYNTQLSITTSYGCTDYKTKKIKILSPGAKYDITPVNACKKELITFTMHDTINLSSYNWDFGDGTGDYSKTYPTVTHRYAKGGQIYVYLNINNPGNVCPRSIKDSLTIDTLTAKFSVADTAGCTDLPILFTNQSSGSISQVWNFSDGPVSTEFSPQHTYVVGKYLVTLAAKSANACIDTARKTITITQTPGITVSIQSCANQQAQLHATGGNYINWSPKAGLNDPTSYDPIAVPSGSVYYKATVTNIDGGCSKSDSVLIIRPMATVTPSFDSLYVGDTIHIQATDTSSIKSFRWDPVTYLSCTDCLNPIAKPLESITYYLILTEANNCFTDSIKVNLLVKFGDEMKFYAPDAFRPGDENNGLFKIYSQSYMELLEFKIYNRWGNLVFSSTDGIVPITKGGFTSKDGWDGKYQGKDQPFDTYIWVASARMFGKEGASIIKNKGTLLLLR